ncbi:hypothetical protein PR202_gb22261 [Eleusine coracana subsp. coracana]|uniref:Uncharacterized protein n=1 Tax=Eleusine coracana subsp. coracana TaxID=191504 RepID=A0AAV5FGT2_ELECO|nr:hypothetical protein PR202_gb22261 [Eleusine coracana subsp. coracana]
MPKILNCSQIKLRQVKLRINAWLPSLVDLLHLALAGVVLQRRHFSVGLSRPVLVDAEAKLEHAVDPGAEGVGVVKAKARGEESGLEEQHHEVLDGLVVLVSICTLAELVHNGVLRVDLHGLLARHVARHARVPQGLCLHDPLHVGSPAVLTCDEAARGVHNTVRDHNLLNFVAQYLLDDLAQPLELLLQLLLPLLLVLALIKLQAFLGGRDKLLSLKVLELTNSILIDGINHVKNLVALLLQLLKERRVLHSLLALPSDVVDVILPLLHPGHIVLEAGQLITALGGVVPQELCKLGPVLGVLMDTKLEVLGEGLVELVVVLLVLSNLKEELNALLHKILADNLQDLVLLEHLTGDVEGKVF